MGKDNFTFIVGGKAGEGVKKAGSVAAQLFIDKGLQVFLMDDYMSLIRGGHNFTVVSAANRWISSQYLDADVIVNSDERSFKAHENELSEGGIMIFNSDEMETNSGVGIPFSSMAKDYRMKDLMYGVGAVASLAASINYGKAKLKEIIAREYPSGKEDNLRFASEIYDVVSNKIIHSISINNGDKKRPILTGNQAISFGAIASGLDTYFAYPMTPASSILHFLADHAPEFGIAVVHPESEIAVINMAIGASFTGARSMVGTSGGGFSLMVEGFSLAGMTEAPILVVFSMRCGPATGVPTYTEQADLKLALNAGHGDFLRIVASPSSVHEAFFLSAEMLDLVWKFQTPGILLTEKHLSESAMTVDLNVENSKWADPKQFDSEGEYKRYLDTEDGISPLIFPPYKQSIKWNSYEHDETGFTTENPDKISFMKEKRHKKLDSFIDLMKNGLNTVNTYGDNGPLIFTYGSTTMSVLEALQFGDIQARLIQPIYLNPFPSWELNQYQNEKSIVVEMSRSGQFADLVKEKAGITSQKVIKKYDGRPFDPIDLSKKLKEVL